MTTKISNVHFEDDIGQDPQEHSTRIFFQNINGLEFNTASHTLLATCIKMQDKQIDIDGKFNSQLNLDDQAINRLFSK